MGPFDPSSPERLAMDRDLRYQKAVDVAAVYLRHGLSVWVDGNFPTATRRSSILDLARASVVHDVVLLQCICSDVSLLEARFARRRDDPALPDSAANSLTAYYGSVGHFEAVDPSELSGFASAEVVVYDSCRGIITSPAPSTPLGCRLHHELTVNRFIRHDGPPSEPSNTD